jgi:putative hemolysin
MSLTLNIFIVIVCLLGTWFFSGIETGLISINRLRLRHLVRRKVPGAETLQFFLNNPDRLFGTTLVGTNLATTVASIVAVRLGSQRLGAEGTWIADVLMTLIILTFCEYFPKAWFQSFPARRSLPFASLLNTMNTILSPIATPVSFFVKLLIPAHAKDQEKGKPFITREEIVHLAGEGKTSGFLTPAEHQMIHEVIQLKTKTCREIMTAREKIVSVNLDMPIGELLELARTRDVSRIPVFDPGKKSFVGSLYLYDVLADTNCLNKCIADYMRPPQLVADYTPVDHVLPRMRVTRQPMVLVTNERFEVIGLVTLTDVLDEIVGSL